MGCKEDIKSKEKKEIKLQNDGNTKLLITKRTEINEWLKTLVI